MNHFLKISVVLKIASIRPLEYLVLKTVLGILGRFYTAETEQDVTIRRLDRERFWMLELGTMYPYGLNDRLQHVGNVSHSYVRSRNNVFNLFNRHQRRKRSHGRRSNSRRNSEITLDQLRNLYNGGQSHGGLHRLRTTLHSARLSNLHKLFDECERLIVANQEQRFRSIVLDVCCKRLFFPVRTGTDSTAKPPRRFIKVFFHNKGIDKVKLTSILHNKLVRSKIPIYFQEKDPPLVSYKYTNTIDWHLNKKILTKVVDDYARNWSKREGCHVSALEAWSETVKLIISNKISNLEPRSFRPCHKILEDPHIEAYLTELQSKYLLVPADKAGNNSIFVCTYYYVHTLMEELGINSRSNVQYRK